MSWSGSFSLRIVPKDWASKRVGFAKADHSQDGEVQGAIGSPEAGYEHSARQLWQHSLLGHSKSSRHLCFFQMRWPWSGGLPCCRSTFEQKRPKQSEACGHERKFKQESDAGLNGSGKAAFFNSEI